MSESSQKVATSYSRFGLDIFPKLYNGKNICISPASIGFALAMAYNGAGNKTKEEMGNILYFRDKDQLK